MLVPFLRGQPGADDAALQERYTKRYYAVANYLVGADDRNPQATRLLVRRELPNLRRALNLLLEGGELDEASVIATRISRFLSHFGLRRERDKMNRRVAEAVSAASARSAEALTHAQLLNEIGLSESEFDRGNQRAAYERFRALLDRIEALPEGAPLGRGSFEHSSVLLRLARCLAQSGWPAAAEDHLRKALAVIEALITQQPNDQDLIRQHGVLLAYLGDVLTAQDKYPQALETYEEALKPCQQLDDLRKQAAIRGNLGTLALKQRHYDEAREFHTSVLDIFQALDEPLEEAKVWHQLGSVAQEQEDWTEAERCYSKSLAINEQHGDRVGAAGTCNQLGNVSHLSGRPAEAEQWYKRALDYPNLPATTEERVRNNFAVLLLDEVREGCAPETRLAEAQRHAERSLEIAETLDAFSKAWTIPNILAIIADRQGRAEAARGYRRREREAYAAFEGNRYRINELCGDLIEAIAAAAQGDEQARAAVEASLPQLEEDGWQIADATRHIWAGERDWQALVEELDRNSALLIRRVLETIAGTEQPAP